MCRNNEKKKKTRRVLRSNFKYIITDLLAEAAFANLEDSAVLTTSLVAVKAVVVEVKAIVTLLLSLHTSHDISLDLPLIKMS